MTACEYSLLEILHAEVANANSLLSCLQLVAFAMLAMHWCVVGLCVVVGA